jgi:hypothetical protein
VAASGRSASDGNFSIGAPPGRYTLETAPGSGPFPRCPSVSVNVEAGEYTTADLACDSGIR